MRTRADLPRLARLLGPAVRLNHGRAWAPVALAAALFATGCGMNQFLQVDRRALDNDVRVLEGGGGNTLVLLHGRDALVVDPKFLGYARGVEQEVEERWGRRVRRIVFTHFHADHTNGAGLFRSVGAVLAQRTTRQRIIAREACEERARRRVEANELGPSDAVPFAQLSGPDVRSMCALPYVDVAAEMRLWLGEEVRVIPLSGHTDGDVAVYLPARKVLATGDLVLSGWLPHLDPEGGANALEMARSLDAMLALPVEKVVPGHGPVGGRELVEVARGYLRAVEEGVRAALQRGAKSEDAVVEQVPLLPEYAALRPIPGDSHALNVRLMFRAVMEADKKAAP